MDSMYNYLSVLSQQKDAEQIADEIAKNKEQSEDQLKQAEDVAGIFGIKGAVEKTIEKVKTNLKERAQNKIDELKQQAEDKFNEVKQKVTDKFNDVKQQATDKINEVKDNVENLRNQAEEGLNNVRQQAENIRGQFQDIIPDDEEILPQVIPGLEKITNQDTFADIVNDSDKFKEYVNNYDDPTFEGLQQQGYNLDTDEGIEEARGVIKNILDNPQSEDEINISNYLKTNNPDFGLDEEPSFLSGNVRDLLNQPSEISGAIRGDSTLARLNQSMQDAINSPVEQIQRAEIPQPQFNQPEEVLDRLSNLPKDVELSDLSKPEGITTTANDISEAVNTATNTASDAIQAATTGAEVATEAGLDATAGVLAGIPGLDILAPILMIGSGLFGILHHPKHIEPQPVFNPSVNFGA